MIRATLFHQSRHLGEDELGPPEVRCRLCGGTAPRAPVARVQEAPAVELLRCAACHASSASRMPTEAALRAYYAQYYVGGGEQVTFSGVERFARHLERIVRGARQAGAAGRILDFGGGDGSIAAALARRLGPGWSVVVVDPGGVTRRSTIDGVPVELLPDLDAVDGGFAVVLASAILEHIPDAGAALDALLQRLQPGGIFYARTPWSVPLARLVPRYDPGFPGHVHDLGGDFWRAAAQSRAGSVRVVRAAPSIVENGLRDAPLRAGVAALLKAPAHLERALRGRDTVPRWRLVGGWEVAWTTARPGA